MNPLDRKSSKTTIDPLINRKCRLKLIYMPVMRSVGIGLVSFFACTALGLAAADFKIRYNQKFPCLEVMDSSAVKITDVTEGAKGETVTSGKSSLNISFIKNSSGQPEVTLRDAKSPLSEMEIEAFGLSVGMKPEGTVLVRFGADNKPKFEMDRTGGSRFLMADLGNLDTAAGKEVAGNTPPSKNLIRCRERLAEWISGKGGWSNKSGKILATQGGDRVQVGELPEREIQVSEAFQAGAKITVGSKSGMMFQSGAGVFHFALPGTVFSLGKLEAGSPDLKVELNQGTLETFVAQPLITPRASLIALGNGEVVRTLDSAYQISKSSGAESITTITTISGKVILAQEAGGKELATLSGEKTWSGAKGGEVKALAGNSPEKASLLAFEGSVRDTALIDIARDGVKACPEAVEEIVSSAVKAKPELAKEIAEQCLAANPKFFKVISQASGVKGLKLSKEEQAKVDALESLDQRLERLAIEGIDLEMKLGQVLLVEGDCNLDGKKEKILVGQVLALNDKIATGKSGRILVGMAPGVVLSVEAGSVVSLEKMSAEIKNGELQSREAVVNSESGLVVMNIAPWNKEKTDVRVKTTEGESVAQGTVYAVNFTGGKMITTVTRGSVGSRDSSGKMVYIAAGQQAAPGATPVAAPANSPEVLAAGKAVESTVSAMVANVAASIAAAIPTAAAEVAAIAAKASPAAAEQIAAAVAAKAPDAAIAIAQAVSKVAPEAASKIAAAVIAATPGMDAKSISAITTASSQGAAEAPSVDTAAGNAGGVGAGSGGMSQSMAATQFQQLQAEQDAKAAADTLKAAADRVQKLQQELAAAKEADKQRLRDELSKASIALEMAKNNNEKAQLDLAAAQAKQTAAATASSNAAATLQNVTPSNAASLVETLKAEAADFVELKKDAQVDAANALIQLQKIEAEKVAQAEAAAAAAKVAADLATKIALSKSQAELNAAAAAAVQAAKDLADAANTKSANATGLAGSTKTAASNFLRDNSAISTEANLYMESSPSIDGKIVVAASRSIASIFTPEQLSGAKGAKLQEFIAKWDAYTDAEMKKYAAAAEFNKLDTAYKAVDALKTTLQNSSFESAKNTANVELLKIQTDADTAAANAQTAENNRLAQAKIEAAAQAAREVAVAAKAAADKLAADLLADVTKAAELAAALNSKLATEAGVAQGALTGLDEAAAAAKAAADKAIADAEEAARQVPVSQGGTKPIQATDTASNLI